MDEITIGDKVYVSSKRAAQITGYAKDYVGQLCREGRVEARLVGRNWYVLDSALREHRFGKQAEEEPKKQESVPESPVATWKRPEYKPEVPILVPNLTSKAPEITEIGSPAIADMQSAWREWFQERKEPQAEEVESFKADEDMGRDEALTEVTSADSSEISSDSDDAEEIHINRIETTPSETPGEVVEIQKAYVPEAKPAFQGVEVATREAYASRLRPQPQQVIGKRETNLAIKMFLIILAVTSLTVAAFGTGLAERFLGGTNINFGLQKSISDYLGGKSEYKSSL